MDYTLVAICTQDVRALLVNTGENVSLETQVVKITMGAIIMVASKMKYLSLNGLTALMTILIVKKNVVIRLEYTMIVYVAEIARA
jgi:hypothetical protein